MSDAPPPLRLTPAEARVLATLMEKARTVPDSYPLTLNALVSGCNQKTSREPVMELDDDAVRAAIDALKSRDLVFESSGGRVARWEHNAPRVLGLQSQHAALLGLLMLRGPQTAAELRMNAERWHRFADTGSVEVFLEEMASRADDRGGPLVRLLARAPGAREARWAHLLCGTILECSESNRSLAQEKWASDAINSIASSDQTLVRRVAALEAQTAALRDELAALKTQLGG